MLRHTATQTHNRNENQIKGNFFFVFYFFSMMAQAFTLSRFLLIILVSLSHVTLLLPFGFFHHLLKQEGKSLDSKNKPVRMLVFFPSNCDGLFFSSLHKSLYLSISGLHSLNHHSPFALGVWSFFIICKMSNQKKSFVMIIIKAQMIFMTEMSSMSIGE